jgi:hypothetical protein
MKNIVLLLMISLSSSVNGQTVYNNKKDYDNAIKNYNDAVESYDNYVKKINFYKNYKYPKNKPYPSSWFEYFKPLLESNGIKLDNYKIRYHENITPDGTIYVNFIVNPNSDFLSVTFSDIPPSNYIYSAALYKFNHPGKSPIFVEKQKKEKIESGTTYSPETSEKTIIEPKMIFVPSTKIVDVPKRKFYVMPNGVKYSYEQLIYYYPSMAYNDVFNSNFKD